MRQRQAGACVGDDRQQALAGRNLAALGVCDLTGVTGSSDGRQRQQAATVAGRQAVTVCGDSKKKTGRSWKAWWWQQAGRRVKEGRKSVAEGVTAVSMTVTGWALFMEEGEEAGCGGLGEASPAAVFLGNMYV